MGQGPGFCWIEATLENNLIIRLLKKRRIKGKLLEAGFCQGDLAIKLIRLPISYSGFEFSKDHVKHTKQRVKALSSTSDIRWGDVRKIPYKDNTFYCVVSSDILEHVEEENKVAKEYLRVLKKGHA